LVELVRKVECLVYSPLVIMTDIHTIYKRNMSLHFAEPFRASKLPLEEIIPVSWIVEIIQRTSLASELITLIRRD
jgi:hypothetical protein